MEMIKKKLKIEDETNWNLILTALLALVVLAVAMGFAFKQWSDNVPKPITSVIRLNNQCGLVDEAFMAASTDGRRVEFANGVAVLQTMTNERVFLKSNPKYPAFGFESPPVKVKESMTLTAQCSNVDRTIDAMREQFQKK
jgi:hypothetical protein